MITFFNICISLLAVFVLVYFIKKDLGLFLLSFIILIQYIWMFFSLVAIETGVFINEQGRNGYFVYSSLVLFCFFVSTLCSLIFFKYIFTKFFKSIKIIKLKFLKKDEITLSIFIFSFIFIIALLNVVLSPSPLISKEVTRFSYWEKAKFPFLQSILGNVMGFMGFGAALLYRKRKKVSIFFLICYFTYLLFIGQKFSGFLIGSYGILLALFYTSGKNIEFKIKWIFNKYLFISLLSIFCLILYQYTLNNPYEYLGLSPFESIFYRAFGLQGHIFWGVTEQYVYIGKPNSWNVSELWKGMHVLMREFWPWDDESFLSVTSRGVSWTNAYPAILVRIFPLWIALIVNFLLMSIVSFVQFFLVAFIKGKSFLISTLSFQLLTWVSFAFTMAYFNKLMAPFIFLTLFFIYKYLLINENSDITNNTKLIK